MITNSWIELLQKPTAIKFSNIHKRVESLDEALRQTSKDVAEIKDLIKDYTTVVKANLAQAESIKEM